MRFVEGVADDGRPLPPLDDPLADEIRAALPHGLFDLRAVFPAAFAEDDQLRSLVQHWYALLAAHGAEQTVAAP
jgi:hypothetical protein